MAIAEFMEFQEIPIKVTLNEYIELSKQYSTPKSANFVNGVLDKLVIDLKEKNSIVKVGRDYCNIFARQIVKTE
jgi:N utilization substance protein B